MIKQDISSRAFEDIDDTIKGKTGGDEYIREAGSDDDKSSEKFIKQYEKEHADLIKSRVSEIKESINEKKRFGTTYEQKIVDYANAELSKLDWPHMWVGKAFFTNGNPIIFCGQQIDTKYGILIAIKRRDGEMFYRAFSFSREIETDYEAVNRLISQAENVIDDAKGLLYLTNPRKKGETINPISPKRKKK